MTECYGGHEETVFFLSLCGGFSVVRVVVFACPLISIDKKSRSHAQSAIPKYFRVDQFTSFYFKINMTVQAENNNKERSLKSVNFV